MKYIMILSCILFAGCVNRTQNKVDIEPSTEMILACYNSGLTDEEVDKIRIKEGW